MTQVTMLVESGYKTYLRDVSLPKAYKALKAKLQSALHCVEHVTITTDG